MNNNKKNKEVNEEINEEEEKMIELENNDLEKRKNNELMEIEGNLDKSNDINNLEKRDLNNNNNNNKSVKEKCNDYIDDNNNNKENGGNLSGTQGARIDGGGGMLYIYIY